MASLLPFESATLTSRMSLEQARTALTQLTHKGIDVDGRAARVFGYARGDRFSLSFGMPLLGGAPVLRGKLEAQGGGVEARLSVGPRIERLVVLGLWFLFMAVFGGYQVALELGARTGTSADHVRAALDVLPRVGFLFVFWLVGVFVSSRSVRRHAPVLIDLVSHCIAADAVPQPYTP